MIEGRAKLQSNANFQSHTQCMRDEKHNFHGKNCRHNLIFKPMKVYEKLDLKIAVFRLLDLGP